MHDKIASGQCGLGFHGSARKIDHFSRTKVGQGADPNSALGLFMSHVPLNALEYAESAVEAGEGEVAYVYVVAFPTQGKKLDLSSDDFFGIDSEGHYQTREHFIAMRTRLLAQGYDHLECETGEDAISVAMHPDRCSIIAVLNHSHVESIESSGVDCLDFVALSDYLKSLNLSPIRHKTNEVESLERS